MSRKKSGFELNENRELLFEKSQHEKYIVKPSLSPDKLWDLTRNNYKHWCQKHYYPGLVNHFKKHLVGFTTWQKQNNVKDHEIIQLGISIFLAPNRHLPRKRLHILNKKSEKYDNDFVSYKLRKNGRDLFGNNVEYTKRKSFFSYSDWCSKNNRKPKILSTKSATAINLPSIRVFLIDEFELLKVGGINAKDVNAITRTHDKTFEFVNLAKLTISNTAKLGGNYQLIFNYCIVDELLIKDSDVVFPIFRNCELRDIKFVNSTLRQFQFEDCIVTGSITDCNIINTKISGGNFRPVLKDTFISDVQLKPIKGLDHKLEHAYKTFKNIYKNQGDDDSARKYHYLEKIEDMKKSKPISKFFKMINKGFWGFGYRPWQIIVSSFVIITLLAAIYTYILPCHFNLDSNNGILSFMDYWYISLVAFTTLGFGDVNPYGYARLFVGFESLFGAMSIGFLVVSLAKNKY